MKMVLILQEATIYQTRFFGLNFCEGCSVWMASSPVHFFADAVVLMHIFFGSGKESELSPWCVFWDRGGWHVLFLPYSLRLMGLWPQVFLCMLFLCVPLFYDLFPFNNIKTKNMNYVGHLSLNDFFVIKCFKGYSKVFFYWLMARTLYGLRYIYT